jgi:hypothetical protein
MPITQITLENFKGVGNAVTVPLRPITLLFGANSAGKSTLLQALLYLRELLENRNADADVLTASGSSINLGGFRQFVHGHDLSHTVRIGVTVTIDDDGLPIYPVLDTSTDKPHTYNSVELGPLPGMQTAGVTVDVTWHSETRRPWITRYSVEINGLLVGSIRAHPTARPELLIEDPAGVLNHAFPPEPPKDPNDEDDVDYPVDGGWMAGSRYDLPEHVIPTFGTPLPILPHDHDENRMFLSPGEEIFFVSHAMVGAGDLVLQELKRIRYIGPIREVPSRSFGAQRTPEESRWANGTAAWDWVHLKAARIAGASTDEIETLDKEFQTTDTEIRSLGLGYRIEPHRSFTVPTDSRLGILIERALRGNAEAFADLDVLPPSELTQIEEHSRLRIVAEEIGVEVAPCDIGVGVAQVLPVVIGSMVPGYSVLAVEQPELHVHPAVQTRLADVLARQVVGTQDRLLLLETHSEHLMLRLLRRIREQQEGELEPGTPEIKPEHLSVLYLSNEGGAMQITELPVTPDGDFSRPWPKGFFAERTQELF